MNNQKMTPAELKREIKQGNEGILIADIRDPNEFNDWHIDGSINVPVNPLLVKGENRLMQEKLQTLPRDKKIVTVCLRGINSQVVTSILGDLGYNAITLENGMKGWNENFDIYEIDFPAFKVVQFLRIGKGCLSYIVYSKDTKSAAVFEPSIFTHEYIDYAAGNKLKIELIIDTHSHADHFSGAMALAKQTGVDYFINSADTDTDFNFTSLKGVDEIKVGNIPLKILNTPGHTDGSLSFLVDNMALICGDLLLIESPGRPDLARTKEDTIAGAGILFDTLQNTILKLNDSIKIFPSHFTKTGLRPVVMSLGELKKQSEPLQMTEKDDFVNFLISNIPQTPPNYESIKKFNKAGVIIPMDYAEDLEIGPNRCAAR